MKIHDDVEQGTEDWFKLRAGIVTASELDNLVTPLWKPRAGDGVETYLARKLAERWTGAPLMTFSGGGAMEQGSIREAEAIPWLQLQEDVRVRRVGFVSADYPRMGCSPDGLIVAPGPIVGVEVKCPEPHTHVRHLTAGVLPKEYAAQVQGSMAVTGAVEWWFMSYCRRFPALVLRVRRDADAVAAIRSAVATFNLRLADGYAKMVELNGGEPQRSNDDAGDDDNDDE